MRYRISDLPSLLRTSAGRRSLLQGQISRFYPLFRMAARFYRIRVLRHVRLVAVVGSLGKTTTTRALASLPGTEIPESQGNADYAVILNLLALSSNSKYGVLEVGITGPGQMLPHARMIRPDIAIVISIAHEHILSFKTLENTREEKAEMVKALPESGTAILNADDPNVMWMACRTEARVITFGLNSQADVMGRITGTDFPRGMKLEVNAGGEIFELNTRLFGRHMAYPLLAALAFAWSEKLDFSECISQLEEFQPVDGRMQLVSLDSGAEVVTDEIKSTRETIWSSLEMLKECRAKRKIVVFGSASEITNDIRYEFHREWGRRIAEAADLAIILNNREIFRTIRRGATLAGMPADRLIRVSGNALSVLKELPDDLGSGDLLLIKGRTDERLARITLALAGRKVGCRLKHCPIRSIWCRTCPWLENGPGDSLKPGGQ